MCAIFGIVGKYDALLAQKAFDTLLHRGEDESHSVQTLQCFVGVHRLAITAIDTQKIQPITQDGTIFVMNGEIYNYRSLASKLGVDLNSDVQVAFAAYQKWGDDFVKHLRGMFAIAIIKNDDVTLFRDPFGKKPLFYTITQESIIFSSELKAIQVLQPASLELKMLPPYLSYQSPIAPYTFDKACRQVEAGSLVYFDTVRTPTTHRYYHPLDTPLTLHTKEDAIQTIHQKLIDSVTLRLPLETACGALLSGGLDSSLIAAMAAAKQPLHTFSVGYDGYEQHDERPFAAEVAVHIGSVHHAYSFGKEDFLQSMDEIISILDEPLADPAMIPLYYLMKQIHKEKIKVVLTGDGSDELFLGYKPYKEFLDLEQLSSLQYKNWMRSFLHTHFSMHKEWEWYKRIFEESTLFRSSAELFTDLQQNRLLRTNVPDNNSLKIIELFKNEFAQSGRTDPVDWYSFIDLKIQLGEVFLRKLDRMSMAHNVEARTPFLDKQLVETIFSVNPDLRKEQIPKNWIKEIAKSYLPQSIIHRKKKGFNYPYMEWLQESGELDVIHHIHQKRKLFHEEHLFWLLKEGKSGKFRHQIFTLYMFCKWIDKKEKH